MIERDVFILAGKYLGKHSGWRFSLGSRDEIAPVYMDIVYQFRTA